MLDGGKVLGRRQPRPRRSGPAAVDGLIVGGREVWVVVAREDEDPVQWLRADGDAGASPLRVCRGILEGGVLLLGDADPERDPLLSDLLRGDKSDRT